MPNNVKKMFQKKGKVQVPRSGILLNEFHIFNSKSIKSVSNDGEFIPGDSIQTQGNSLYNRLIVNLLATCPTCEICSFGQVAGRCK